MSLAYSGVAPVAAPVAYGGLTASAYGGAYGGYPGVGAVSSYPAMTSYPSVGGFGGFGGFGYGAGVPAMPPVDIERIETQKAAQLEQVTNYTQAVKGQMEQQADHQRNLIIQQAEREIALLSAQISQRREQQWMAIDQQAHA